MHEFPQVFIFDASGDESEAAEGLARQLAQLDVTAPFIVASIHGDGLVSKVEGAVGRETVLPGADQGWAIDLGARARSAGAGAILAAGGGRCLDVAKLAAARAGLGLIAAPTQLSHDGICSPVAVVPRDDGRGESLGAIPPRAVYLSLPTLIGAPLPSLRAGIGDLLANPLALRDWALAAERGLEHVDQRAWDLSVESFQSIQGFLKSDPAELARDASFLRRLADALVLSGMAMICSGTSRPASGGEHQISHAIDELFAGRAHHGAQVAFGCIFSAALYGEDAARFRGRLARVGLPHRPSDLGLDKSAVVRILLHAPNTRPGRFTVLEEANLDEEAARRLVEEIWEDDEFAPDSRMGP